MLRKAKGIGLLSGGLDSAVAALVVRDAGAEVECLHFFTGFCVTGHNSRVGRKDRPIANTALQVAAEMGIPVEMIDISETYLSVVLEPKFGYGRHMNPCLDCRVFMLRQARDYMERVGADFVFTGEVIGQRPKSQLKKYLIKVEVESGLEGKLLRPLSAKFMPPTDVEEAGLIDRNRLLDIHGRGRKRQIALARRYGLSHYSSPSGGCCFLADEAYSQKLADMIEHHGSENITLEDVFVLGVGRHFRFSPRTKIIVGRDEAENAFLGHFKRDHWWVAVDGFQGPTAIVVGELADVDIETVASVVARYSDGRGEEAVQVRFNNGERRLSVTTRPAVDDVVDMFRI